MKKRSFFDRELKLKTVLISLVILCALGFTGKKVYNSYSTIPCPTNTPCVPFSNNDLWQIWDAILTTSATSGTSLQAVSDNSSDTLNNRIIRINNSLVSSGFSAANFLEFINTKQSDGSGQGVFIDGLSVFKDVTGVSAFRVNGTNVSVFKDSSNKSVFTNTNGISYFSPISISQEGDTLITGTTNSELENHIEGMKTPYPNGVILERNVIVILNGTSLEYSAFIRFKK